MLRVRQSPITTQYIGSIYPSEDIDLSPILFPFFDRPEYTMRARVALALELILISITDTMPKHQILDSNFVVAISFGLQEVDFLLALEEELKKHFQFYSSRFSTSVHRKDDFMQVRLTFPSAIINTKWSDATKTKSLGTNPEHYSHISQMLGAILLLAENQLIDPESSLEIKIKAMALIRSISAVAKQVQSWNPEGLRGSVKKSLLELVAHCEESVNRSHLFFIAQLSGVIQPYFKFDHIKEDKRPLMTSMLAELIAPKVDLLEVLKYKTKQHHDAERSTDYRLPIVFSDVDSDIAAVLQDVQHGALALTGATAEYLSESAIEQLPWCAVEASHWDDASQTQLLLVLNLQSKKLDLHGFDANNAKTLLAKFLQHQFFNLNVEPLTVDVGKASHSPDNKSRLAPVITRMLKFYQLTVPGLIDAHEDYNQNSGYISVQPRAFIDIELSAKLTEAIVANFDASLPTKCKMEFYDAVKDRLDKIKLASNALARFKISFETEASSELQQYLKTQILGQKLAGYFNLRNSLVVWDKSSVGSIEFIVVPKELADLIPSADRFLTIIATRGSPVLKPEAFA